MTELERLLKSVAQEAERSLWPDVSDGFKADARIEAVLRRRLLPLLEAGQANAEYCRKLRAFLMENFGLEKISVGVDETWDAAKQKAMEP